MTSFPRVVYGAANPNAGKPANGDFSAWGSYSWPGGVPAYLLGRTNYASTFGQRLNVTMRRELVPLWNLAFQIMDLKHHYCVYAVKDGEQWGPWGYENRAVSGTSYASGHSMGLSVDTNAPYNPYSYTFTCDMPPGMVGDLEWLGLYWGGRYQGQKYDPMHFGYCYPPEAIPGHLTRARLLLGQDPNPPQPDDGDDMPLSTDDINKVADEVIKRLRQDDIVVFNKTDAGSGHETHAKGSITDALGVAATYAGRAAYRATKIDNENKAATKTKT